MERGLMLVKSVSDGSSLAVLAAPEYDMDLVAYEMTMLVEAVGDTITPATRPYPNRPATFLLLHIGPSRAPRLVSG
jgi:hypothetical protein